jgi:hypothetical protein
MIVSEVPRKPVAGHQMYPFRFEICLPGAGHPSEAGDYKLVCDIFHVKPLDLDSVGLVKAT